MINSVPVTIEKIMTEEFAVISDNCFSVGVYKLLNMRYTSPFMFCIIPNPEYIKLLGDFDKYLSLPLKFMDSWEDSKYHATNHVKTEDVGLLGDVEIHFMHAGESYLGRKDIAEKDARRLERFMRVPKDKILFKFGDLTNLKKERLKYDNFEKLIADFHALPLKNKVSFTFEKWQYEGNYVMHNDHTLNSPVLGRDVQNYFDLKKMMESN